jgi:hypothetical protein
LLIVLAKPVCAQSLRHLEQNEFDTDILNQWWSFDSKINNGGCDMRIFIARSGNFEFNCINWSNGFSGSKCGYSLSLQNDFFEIAAKDCKESANPGFIYGYLIENYLFLLSSDKKLSMTSSLLTEKNWYKYEKIKR